MKLITKAIERKLERHPLYSQDGKGKDADILVKFFTPDAQFTWLVLEANRCGDDWEFFGLVRNYPYDWEYGYFMFSQLKDVRGHLGLPIERDLYFIDQKVGDVMRD